jgi:hypothetical protein
MAGRTVLNSAFFGRFQSLVGLYLHGTTFEQRGSLYPP